MQEQPTSPASNQFKPRLGRRRGPAPYRPGAYFYVAFFGGFIAVALVAIMNLPRLTVVKDLALKTYVVIGVMTAAAIAYMVINPELFSTSPSGNSSIRLGLRMVAVAGSIGLYALHKGPAVGTLPRDGEYTSMWKAIGPIIAAAIGQGILTATILATT